MSSIMVQMFVILYMAFGVVIEELCPSPLLFLCVVVRIWLMMKTLAFWWNLHNVLFCNSELIGFAINKVFEYLNNVVGKFSVLYKIKREDFFFIIFIRSSLWIRLWSMCGWILGCKGVLCFPNPWEIRIFTLLHCLIDFWGFSKTDK